MNSLQEGGSLRSQPREQSLYLCYRGSMSHFPQCRWKKAKTALVLIALLPSLVYAELHQGNWAQEGVAQEYEQFQFFNDCKPVRFGSLVPYHSDAIRGLVELKLRRYRLYDEATSFGDSTLWLLVGSFGHRLQYRKALYDPASSYTAKAVTWQAADNTGPDDLDGLLKSISVSVDLFLNYYMRVNEKACVSR